MYSKKAFLLLLSLILCLFFYNFLGRTSNFPFFEIRYCGNGRDLGCFAMLGGEISPQHPVEFSRFFAFLQTLTSSDIKVSSCFSLRSFLFWNEKKGLWEEFFMFDRVLPDNFLSARGDCPYRCMSFSEKSLVFSSSLSEKEAKGFVSDRWRFFTEQKKPMFEWTVEDGGFLREKWPRFCEGPLSIQGNFSLDSGKGIVSWKLMGEGNLFLRELFEVPGQQIPEKRQAFPYLPLFMPSPVIFEGGGESLGRFACFMQHFLLYERQKGIDAPFPIEWINFLEKVFSRFSDVYLPFAFVLGGEARVFTTSLPGFILHFPEGGGEGCGRVEGFWKRVRFLLKPSRVLEDRICGGMSSFPVSILMMARQNETLGGWITEKSFLNSEARESRYEDFFGNSLSSSWVIVDFFALHAWMESFLFGENILTRIPFNLLAKIYELKDLSEKLTCLGILGCSFFEGTQGKLVISSDIF